VDVVIKGRNLEVPDHFRQLIVDKMDKIGRYDPKMFEVEVELSHERNRRQSGRCQRVEITCRSRGPAVRAEACAGDFYSALDASLTRLEARLRKSADRRRLHRGTRTPVSVAAATATLPAGLGDGASAELRDGDPDPYAASSNHREALAGEAGEGPMLVREKLHRAVPMTLDQALYEMELVGHDFFLFQDKDSGLPSVVYRRRGYDYGVIRLETRLAAVEGAFEGAVDGVAGPGQSAHREQDLPLRSTM
jgi:ribosomal subunit interface protein